MSIPFSFQPVHVMANDATLRVKVPGADATGVDFAESRHTWVDGSLLAKCSIHSFDRVGESTPEVPAIGIKLSRFQTEYEPKGAHESAIAIVTRRVKTMTNEWDALTTRPRLAPQYLGRRLWGQLDRLRPRR